MGYQDPQVFRRLEDRVDWERHRPSQQEYRLDRMRAYSSRAGDPHRVVPCYHVAGSKGKGSTSLYLARGLEAIGLRTGLYQSPHLAYWSERITQAGRFWDAEVYERALGRALELATEGETVFEVLTLAAWLAFQETACDRAVLEVGLGGRLDATNLVDPLCAILTSIELEHTEILGSTLPQIASEKAGIVKPHRTAWTYHQVPEVLTTFADRCAKVGSPLKILEEQWDLRIETRRGASRVWMRRGMLKLEWVHRCPGPALARNAALAVAALVDLENPSAYAARQAAEAVGDTLVPGRMEWVPGKPALLLDGAHTPSSLTQLAQVLATYPRRAVVFGCNVDKDAPALAQVLRELDCPIVLTRSDHPRSFDPQRLSALFGPSVAVEPDPVQALQRALSRCPADGVVAVTGSLFLVGQLRRELGLC